MSQIQDFWINIMLLIFTSVVTPCGKYTLLILSRYTLQPPAHSFRLTQNIFLSSAGPILFENVTVLVKFFLKLF